jgi:hypothetical protein
MIEKTDAVEKELVELIDLVEEVKIYIKRAKEKCTKKVISKK